MKYFLLFSILFLTFLQANQNKEVLLIHSYHKGYVWTDDISKTIEKNFDEHKDIELTTVYMDTKRIDDDSYLENLAKLYKQQFSNRKFDLILISDNNAFDFLAKYYDYLFKDIPVLFCGINNYSKEILEKLSFKKIRNRPLLVFVTPILHISACISKSSNAVSYIAIALFNPIIYSRIHFA